MMAPPETPPPKKKATGSMIKVIPIAMMIDPTLSMLNLRDRIVIIGVMITVSPRTTISMIFSPNKISPRKAMNTPETPMAVIILNTRAWKSISGFLINSINLLNSTKDIGSSSHPKDVLYFVITPNGRSAD